MFQKEKSSYILSVSLTDHVRKLSYYVENFHHTKVLIRWINIDNNNDYTKDIPQNIQCKVIV